MILNHYLMLSKLINYYDVLFVLQQHFRICLWCQCINLVSSSPSFLSGLRYPSCHLNLTTVSDADAVQLPDAQEETCFSLGQSTKPSCPSAMAPCFLNPAQRFNPHLLRGSPSPLRLEDVQTPSLVRGILFHITVQHNLMDCVEEWMFWVLSAATGPCLSALQKHLSLSGAEVMLIPPKSDHSERKQQNHRGPANSCQTRAKTSSTFLWLLLWM